MEYTTFQSIMDKHINSINKIDFVKNLIKTKDSAIRIFSNFKITSLKDRIRSNYLISVNIKLGDALEDVFKKYLEEAGAIFLERDFVPHKDCDQIFMYNGITYLIEQKIRDDHDSSKKVGQVENYNMKKTIIQEKVTYFYACSWFIDPDFDKNKNYYLTQLNADELYYGQEIEIFLTNKVFHDDRCNGFFLELINYLEQYSHRFSTLDLTDLSIDFHDFTTTELYRLLQSKVYLNQVAEIFFNKNIPFEDIYTYIDKNRTVNCTYNFKKLLEEYMNESKL